MNSCILGSMDSNPGGGGIYPPPPIIWGHPSNIYHQCPSPKFTARKHAKFNRIDHFQHEFRVVMNYLVSKVNNDFIAWKISIIASNVSKLLKIDLNSKLYPPNDEDGFASLLGSLVMNSLHIRTAVGQLLSTIVLGPGDSDAKAEHSTL